jgi:hypothetical protein
LLSHATLTNIAIGNKNAWTVHNRLSLGGLADVALEQYLFSHQDVRELNFCLDNDEKGIEKSKEFAAKYQEKGYTVNICLPNKKDYNDELVNFTHIKEKIITPKPPPMCRR